MKPKVWLLPFIGGVAIALIYASPARTSPLPSALWQGDENFDGCGYDNDPCAVTAGAAAQHGSGGSVYQPVNGTYVAGQPVILPPDLKAESAFGASAPASASFGLLPFPGIIVTASDSSDSVGFAVADASAHLRFTYYMEITGAVGDVPVFVQAQGSASYQYGLSNGAMLQITGGNSNYVWEGGASFHVSQLLTLATNTLYEVAFSREPK
jgi:hypothetical protein